jgi:transcriptional regulator GlxA family with amidase domain
LQKWHAKGIHIAASCIGSFILADAGLLDHCEATTTWWLAPLFRQRYPKVLLDESRMLVPSGQLVTTGALLGHLSLQDAADALATSPRSLQRRCEAVLGKSPLAYIQDLRVERARSLIHGSGLDIEAIALEVGYIDGATLRTLLRRRLGRGVRELRAELR